MYRSELRAYCAAYSKLHHTASLLSGYGPLKESFNNLNEPLTIKLIHLFKKNLSNKKLWQGKSIAYWLAAVWKESTLTVEERLATPSSLLPHQLQHCAHLNTAVCLTKSFKIETRWQKTEKEGEILFFIRQITFSPFFFFCFLCLSPSFVLLLLFVCWESTLGLDAC